MRESFQTPTNRLPSGRKLVLLLRLVGVSALFALVAVFIRNGIASRIPFPTPAVAGGNLDLRELQRILEELLRAGIHMLVVDLFPPTPRDPQGIHKAIWDEFVDNEFALPPDRPLTLAAYIGGVEPEAFVEPAAVGSALAEMPLFLTPERYVPVPLDTSYQSAWEAVPASWRNVLEHPAGP
jgi:hypothetical protein